MTRYFDALAADLRRGRRGRRRLAGRSRRRAGARRRRVLAPIREALAGDLVQPLRDRLAAGIDAVDGDNEDLTKKARAIYREWKTKRIDDELDDLLRHAYGRGAFAAIAEGQPVRWVFDPAVGACSDCEDNSLQGAVPPARRSRPATSARRPTPAAGVWWSAD